MATKPATDAPVDRTQALQALAEDALAAFERITESAARMSGQRPAGVDAFAAINELTAARAVENLGRIQADLSATYRRLTSLIHDARFQTRSGHLLPLAVLRGRPASLAFVSPRSD